MRQKVKTSDKRQTPHAQSALYMEKMTKAEVANVFVPPSHPAQAPNPIRSPSALTPVTTSPMTLYLLAISQVRITIPSFFYPSETIDGHYSHRIDDLRLITSTRHPTTCAVEPLHDGSIHYLKRTRRFRGVTLKHNLVMAHDVLLRWRGDVTGRLNVSCF